MSIYPAFVQQYSQYLSLIYVLILCCGDIFYNKYVGKMMYAGFTNCYLNGII